LSGKLIELGDDPRHALGVQSAIGFQVTKGLVANILGDIAETLGMLDFLACHTAVSGI